VLGNIFASEGTTKRGKPAVVSGEWVYGPELPNQGIRLDRPAWFAWLTEPTTTSFSYPLHDHRCGYIAGFMTVRKEPRQRGGSYWTAYRRQGRRLRKIYLGSTSALTQARLDAVAATLLSEGGTQEGANDTHPPQG
jgi:LuxR family maltose regulon positive regulatory protein